MTYEKKTWYNVPDPSKLTDEQVASYPRFDAENMNRIEAGIDGALSKVKAIDGQDILEITKEGFYYSTRTVNVPTSEVAGYIHVQMSSTESYRVVYWRPYNSITEHMNVLKNGTWLGWVEMLTSQGGTLTGHMVFENLKAFHAIKKGRTIGDVTHNLTVGVSSDGASTLEHYTGDVLDGRLELNNVEGNNAALKLRGNSSGNQYRVFGEHNKPSGSYLGNGETNTRTIKIGGICNNLLVYGDDMFGIITSVGAIVKDKSTNAINLSGQSYIISNGNLVIGLQNTDYNFLFNSSGITYYYQVL